jgi:CheY-like chemotaxis protein
VETGAELNTKTRRREEPQMEKDLVGIESELFPASSAVASSLSPFVSSRLRVNSGRAVIRVRDTGIGIEPETLPRLFDSFTQADRTLDRRRGGLGLGLTVVKGLAELHGGEVEARSAGLGRGSEFTFRLPWPPQPAAPPAPAAGRTKPALSGPRRILVVEDNPDAAESLRELLELFGHEAHVALTGPAGVEAARRLQPEVVLCDLGLPGMDGYAVAAALRQEPATAQAWLVAISGYGQEEDRQHSQAAGFDLHLVKPVEYERLVSLFEPARRD